MLSGRTAASSHAASDTDTKRGNGYEAPLHMSSPVTLLEFATTATGTGLIPSSFGERLL